MGKHHLFTAEVGEHCIGNSMSGSYICSPEGVLKVFWKDRQIFSDTNALGKMYQYCGGNPASAGPVKMPKNPVRRIFWQMGFFKGHEVTLEDRQESLEDYMNEYSQPFNDQGNAWQWAEKFYRYIERDGKQICAVTGGRYPCSNDGFWAWCFDWKEGTLQDAKLMARLLGHEELAEGVKIEDNSSHEKDYVLTCNHDCKNCIHVKVEEDSPRESLRHRNWMCDVLPECATDLDMEYPLYNNERCLHCSYLKGGLWQASCSKVNSLFSALYKKENSATNRLDFLRKSMAWEYID